MFSNTATPYYYGRFREKVIAGEIPVCREVAMEMKRIDKLIANPGVWYDSNAVKGYIDFCEKECTLTDGSPLFLMDSFKLWAEEIFGWYYFIRRSVYDPKIGTYVKKVIKKRLINKQFVILGRGGAKTMYGSTLQNFFLNVDPTTTHQITTAPTMRQADEILAPIRTAINRSPGPYFKFLTEGSLQNTTGNKANRVKLASTKMGIQNFLTGSLLEIRPMSIDKLQGLNTKCATIDEWLSGDTREDPILAIEQGAAKVDDYLIVAISSEGTTRGGCGDTIKMELTSILTGKYDNPHVSIWWYKLDDIMEVKDIRMWPKAQPNLGFSVSYETYQLEQDKAEKVPSSRNEILAKRFGLPMEGTVHYFRYEETLPTHDRLSFKGMSCSMGIDLSQGGDFCAFTFLFPLRREDYGIKTRCYISRLTYNQLPMATREKYLEFIKEDSLCVMEQSVLDMQEVYDDLEIYIDENDYDICSVGYDVYNSQEFMPRWISEHGEFAVVKVPQGARTESVPLAELKHLAEEGLLLHDQKIITWTMGNCIVLVDTNANKKLSKRRYEDKIDSVSALLDAYVAYKVNKDAFE